MNNQIQMPNHGLNYDNYMTLSVNLLSIRKAL
jgi:hypothetical protein